MLQRVLKTAHHRGFTLRNDLRVDVLAEKAQYDPFHKSCSERHDCLNPITAIKNNPYANCFLVKSKLF